MLGERFVTHEAFQERLDGLVYDEYPMLQARKDRASCFSSSLRYLKTEHTCIARTGKSNCGLQPEHSRLLSSADQDIIDNRVFIHPQ